MLLNDGLPGWKWKDEGMISRQARGSPAQNWGKISPFAGFKEALRRKVPGKLRKSSSSQRCSCVLHTEQPAPSTKSVRWAPTARRVPHWCA